MRPAPASKPTVVPGSSTSTCTGMGKRWGFDQGGPNKKCGPNGLSIPAPVAHTHATMHNIGKKSGLSKHSSPSILPTHPSPSLLNCSLLPPSPTSPNSPQHTSLTFSCELPSHLPYSPLSPPPALAPSPHLLCEESVQLCLCLLVLVRGGATRLGSRHSTSPDHIS